MVVMLFFLGDVMNGTIVNKCYLCYNCSIKSTFLNCFSVCGLMPNKDYENFLDDMQMLVCKILNDLYFVKHIKK